MAKDKQGLTLAGSPEALDRAVADYYGLTGDPVGVLKRALARDPEFSLGGVAIAMLYLWSLKRLSSERRSLLIGVCDFIPAWGRCQLYRCSQVGSSSARRCDVG